MNIPTGKNKFCGPFAIAALTGGTTDDASRLVRLLTGRRSVMGMSTIEMGKALTSRGRLHKVYRPRCTLNQWINNHAKPDTQYVVLVTGHYIAVDGNRVACSQKRTPVRLDDVTGKRRKVWQVWELNRGE